jgi:hypothetical protein
MKISLRGAKISLACALFACLAGQAQAIGRLADIRIVDQETGQNLPVYQHRGECWVAGTPGHRYSVVVGNQSPQRLLAVTAVDGINVVTGDSAAYGQNGYVFDAWQSYAIDGWRKSDAEVAAFVFTAAPASYAARTGRAANIGVIGVALFNERIPTPVLRLAPKAQAEAERGSDAVAAAPASAPLGTGHGERQYSAVSRTEFERASRWPDEIVRIRYDSLEHLMAMGVIRQPQTRPAAPNAFPGASSEHYVPDPPGNWPSR